MVKREESLQIRRWLNVWRQSEKYRRTNRLFISKTKENRRCKFNYEKVRRESLSKSFARCENLHSERKTTRIEEFRFCKSAESSFFSRNIFRNEERKTNFKNKKTHFFTKGENSSYKTFSQWNLQRRFSFVLLMKRRFVLRHFSLCLQTFNHRRICRDCSLLMMKSRETRHSLDWHFSWLICCPCQMKLVLLFNVEFL